MILPMPTPSAKRLRTRAPANKASVTRRTNATFNVNAVKAHRNEDAPGFLPSPVPTTRLNPTPPCDNVTFSAGCASRTQGVQPA